MSFSHSPFIESYRIIFTVYHHLHQREATSELKNSAQSLFGFPAKAYDQLRLIALFAKFLLPYGFEALAAHLQAAVHKRTYTLVELPQNVVVIGGAYAEVELAKKLANTLPTGYRVVMIEKNSHFNYTFNFPRTVSYKAMGNLRSSRMTASRRRGQGVSSNSSMVV